MEGKAGRAVGIRNHQVIDYDMPEAFEKNHEADVSLSTSSARAYFTRDLWCDRLSRTNY